MQEQDNLFSEFTDRFADRREEWINMPEFVQEDLMPERQIIVSFRNEQDVKEFAGIVNQKITDKTKSIWYPHVDYESALSKYIWHCDEKINTRYPIYIISKGRASSRLTSKALENMNVDYKICVEPKEYDLYASVINSYKIIKLPENFSELKQGSIPVRNFVWQHSIDAGFSKHWILDDNINWFCRLTNNIKVKVDSPVTFRAIEDFCDRYENVKMAGMNYQWFAKQKQFMSPFILNTRIYSCILLSNDIDMRWRGKYNEDTDLSIRILKNGYCTVLFNAFLCDKVTTMAMSGGNTDSIYNTGDNRLEFAQSLKDQHPDIVEVTEKFGRFHHQVDYSRFKRNKLIKKNDVIISDEINNYGMKLVKV